MFEVILGILLNFFIAHIHKYSRWRKLVKKKSFLAGVDVETVLFIQSGKTKVHFLYYVCRYGWNHGGLLKINICRMAGFLVKLFNFH